MRKTTIYFAGPLFTQAEWRWNAEVAQALRKLGYEVTLPQERAQPMLDGREAFDPQILFDENVEGIREASLVVAILDGADADSGTCWEIGYAFALGRPVIGLRTDLRRGGDDPNFGVNLMLSCACRGLIAVPFDKRNDVAWVVAEIRKRLAKPRNSKK